MKPPLKKRILLMLAAFAIQSIYTPTSLLLEGGIEPKLPWDVFPLQVVWVIPYTLCYPLWAFSIAWLIRKMDEKLFRATIAGSFFAFSLGGLIYILFPTYVVHPDIAGNDILSKLLLLLISLGGDHDALPSAHVYLSVILALFYGKWYPKYRWLWACIVIIIAFSTLFTRQHYVADVIAGMTTAWLGYRFGWWWSNRYTSQPGFLRRSAPTRQGDIS
ncbi:MAG TPA: phosphatase PAP2 family protein [Anaerolineales bacterium]|nr:phosphatase PAP2 family protein [Anaerolineales bacterium]